MRTFLIAFFLFPVLLMGQSTGLKLNSMTTNLTMNQPSAGTVPFWNDTAKKWSNAIPNAATVTNAQPPSDALTNLANNSFTTISNANILYVDINGNNTTAKRGRPDKPWREVTNAVSSATSGDTILIGPGRWTNNTTMLLGDRVSMVGSGQGVTVITNTVDLGSGGVGLQPGMNNSYIGFLSIHAGDPIDEVLRGPLGAGDAGAGAARGFTNSVWESLDVMGWSDSVFVQNTNRCTWRAINCRFRSNVDIIVQARTNHVGEYIGCTFLTTSTSAGVGEFHPITIHAGISYFVNSLIVSSNGNFHRSVVVEPDAFAHFYNSSIPVALPGDHQITNAGSVFISDPSLFDPVKLVGGGTYTYGNSNVTYRGKATASALTLTSLATNSLLRVTDNGQVVTQALGANLSMSADGVLSASGSGGGGPGSLAFNLNQFDTNATVNLKSGALITNAVIRGDNRPTLTASTVAYLNGNKDLTNVVNGTGMLTNDGSGVVGWMSIPSGGSGGTNFPAAIIQTNLITGQATASANTINALRGDYQIVNLGSHTNMNYVPYPGQESNVWTTVMFTQNSTGGYYPTNNGVTLYIPTNANAVGFARYGVYNGVTNVEVAISTVLTNPIGGQTVLYDGTNGVFRNSTSPTSGSSISTNGNQFGPSVQLTLRDGLRTTNLINYGIQTNVSSTTVGMGIDGPNLYSIGSFEFRFGVNGATNWAVSVGSGSTGSLLPANTNAFDLGGFFLPIRTNWVNDLVAKEAVAVTGESNGIVQLATSLTIPDHMTNVFGFDAVTRTYFYKLPDTNVTVNGNTEDYAPIVFNPQTFTITNGAPVWQVGVTNDTVSFRPMIGLANARSYQESRILGVATMNIPAGSYGWITTKGSVNGINLLALCPGGITTNSQVYLNSTSGTFTTNNSPESLGTNFAVYVGRAISTNILMLQDAPDPVYDRPIYSTVITTDGTATTLYAITPPNNSTIVAESTVWASTSGAGASTNASGAYRFFSVIVTTNNTTRMITGTIGAVTTAEDITGWNAFWTNQTATTAALRVVGAASTSNKWVHATTFRGTPFLPLY